MMAGRARLGAMRPRYTAAASGMTPVGLTALVLGRFTHMLAN